MPHENSPLVTDDTAITVDTTIQHSDVPYYKILLADGVSLLGVAGFTALSSGIGVGIGAAISEWDKAVACFCVGKGAMISAGFTGGLSGGIGASLGAATVTPDPDSFLQRRADECGSTERGYLVHGCGAWQGLGFAAVSAIVVATTGMTYDLNTSMIFGAVAGAAGSLLSTAATACYGPKNPNILTCGRRLFGLYERNERSTSSESESEQTYHPGLTRR